MGSVARHLGSCWIRDRTRVSCIGRWILYHWATREVPADKSCRLNQADRIALVYFSIFFFTYTEFVVSNSNDKSKIINISRLWCFAFSGKMGASATPGPFSSMTTFFSSWIVEAWFRRHWQWAAGKGPGLPNALLHWDSYQVPFITGIMLLVFRTLSPPIPAWAPVGVWVFEPCSCQRVFLLGSTLALCSLLLCLECHFLLGSSVQISDPSPRPGPRPTLRWRLAWLLWSWLLCFYTDRRAQHLVLHVVLFPVFSLLDGNIPKVRKLSLPFSPFAWVACGILVPQTGSGVEPACTLQWKCGVLTTGQPEKFQHHLLIFYTHHCKIINAYPLSPVKRQRTVAYWST